MNVQWKLAARYLWGRKLRTVLTTLAVVFGVTIIFGLNAILPTFLQAFTSTMQAGVGQVDLTVQTASGAPFPNSVVDEVSNTEGVAVVDGALYRTVILPDSLAPAANKFSSTGNIIVAGVNPVTVMKLRQYIVAEGDFFKEGESGVVVLSETLAEKLSLKLGDSLTLPSATGTMKFQIVGLLTTFPGPTPEEVYIPLTDAQALFNLPGQINLVEGTIKTGTVLDDVVARLHTSLGEGFNINVQETGTEMFAAIEVGKSAFYIFGILALAMGAFVIYNTFRTVVVERRHDIGMLRALGASRSTIRGLFLIETLIQGIGGAILGILCGYLLAFGFTLMINIFGQQLLHIGVGAPVIEPSNLLVSMAIGIGFTVASGLLPAMAASHVTPMEALRPAPAQIQSHAMSRSAIIGLVLACLGIGGLLTRQLNLAALGLVLFIIGLVLCSPMLVKPLGRVFSSLLNLLFKREGRLAEGNLTRNPDRAAITASAVMIGLMIALAMSGMITSIFGGFSRYLDKSLGADYLFMPSSLLLSGGNVAASPELAKTIAAVPGVGTISTIRYTTSKTVVGDTQVIGIDPVTFPQVSGLEFSRGNENDAYRMLAEGRAVIVNGLFAAQRKVNVGDVITFESPRGPLDYTVAGVGLDYLNAKLATAYISQENLSLDFNVNNDMLIMANQAKGTDSAVTQKDLEKLVSDYPALTFFKSEVFRKSQTDLLNQALVMFYVILAALVIPGLIAMINTLAINVIERTREIGVLRAVGATRQQVSRMVLAESLLLSAFGILLGIVTGLMMGAVLVAAMNTTGFKLPYYFPWNGIVATIVIGLVFGILAAIIPARQASRMEIIKALHYE
ncbi:MAG: FtsX-like permease family protein [Anaerolineaceae bacterium]